MKKAALVVLGLSVLCLSANAAPKSDGQLPETANITGTWKAEVDLGGNSGNPEFTLKQNGTKITGKYKGQFGEADVTGKITDNKFEFSFAISEGKAVYTGTLDKDTMKGDVKYGDQLSGTWTAKREAAKKN